mgnify:CR=1 FL=1
MPPRTQRILVVDSVAALVPRAEIDGEIVGRGFPAEDLTDAIETIVETYLSLRGEPSERFIDAYRRVGAGPFKEALYA